MPKKSAHKKTVKKPSKQKASNQNMLDWDMACFKLRVLLDLEKEKILFFKVAIIITLIVFVVLLRQITLLYLNLL